MTGLRGVLAAAAGCFLLGGIAAASPAPRLGYAMLDVERSEHLAFAAALPVGGGNAAGSPVGGRDRAVGRGVAEGATWRLTVEGGMVADSNVTNASNDRFIDVQNGDDTVPVALDPSLRKRAGRGREAAVSAGIRLRLSDGAAFMVDAEGRAVDHKGGRNDDISFLLAAGPELTWSGGGTASLQAVASQRWYGGTSSSAGVGLRGRIGTRIAEGRRVSLSVDVRTFDSGYGDDFAGWDAGATLGASAALDAVTTGWTGLYGRREWLGAEAYSNLELGGYAGASRYLGDALTATLTAGASRTLYDAPMLHLSPARREDWRWWAGAQLTTRRPIGLGVYPTLSYSYNRTDGSIELFDVNRHRVRLGVQRSF